MSNIVNKIIYNTLIKEGRVTLPELGTLRLEGEPRVLLFQENIDPEAPILTEILMREGGISGDEAESLYGDWRTSSREEDGSIDIDGVGRIPARTILMDGGFDKALNHSQEPLPTARIRKRRTDSWLWWVLGIAVVAFAVIWSLLPWSLNAINIGILGEEEKESKVEAKVEITTEVEPFVEEEIVEITPAAEAQSGVEAEVKPTVEPKAEPAVEHTPQQQTNAPATNKRYNLSVGVYSTKQNAIDCTKRDPLGIGQNSYLIGNYPGGKWVVMAHSTNSWAEADKLRAKYRRQGKEVWIYQRY